MQPMEPNAEIPNFRNPIHPGYIDISKIPVKPPIKARRNRLAEKHPEWLPCGRWPDLKSDPYGPQLRDNLIAMAGIAADVRSRDYNTQDILENGVLFYAGPVLHVPMESQDTNLHCFIVQSDNPGIYKLDGYALDEYGVWRRQVMPMLSRPDIPGLYLPIETRARRSALYYGAIKKPYTDEIIPRAEACGYLN